MQVFLVTGGAQYSGGDIDLDSTEVLEDIAGTWKETAPLPSARTQLRAASVENNIFVFGENILYYINIEHLIPCYNVYNDHIHRRFLQLESYERHPEVQQEPHLGEGWSDEGSKRLPCCWSVGGRLPALSVILLRTVIRAQ